MSRTAQKLISASGGKAYEIEQSLLFDKTDGAYLIRDDGDITDGNKRTFTFATWFKKVQVGANDILFNVRNGGGNELFMVYIPGSEQTMWIFQKRASDGNTIWYLEPNQKLRDVGAWYHFVIAVDTTQSTAADRVKLYINGTQVTSFTGSSSYPDQNLDTPCNNDSFDHQIGYNGSAGLDGYMAETYLIDGTAQAASAFGETDAVTGAWIPKKYTGSYGNNGFYLKYASGALGTDSSGQGNNYTANNLANSDVTLDTPTNNYPTINSLEPYNSTVSTLVQGNRKVLAASYSSGNYGNHFMTFKIPESGKWYVEMVGGVQAGSGNRVQLVVNEGHIIPSQSSNIASNANSTGIDLTFYGNTLDMYDGGSTVGTQVTGLTASYYVLALAIDVDNNKVYGGYDSGSGITWLNSGDPAGNSNGTAHTFTSDTKIGVATTTSSDNANRSYLAINFGQSSAFGFSSWSSRNNTDGSGQGDFYYTPPSGFKALCSKNLPTPAVKKSTEHFDIATYTGTGSTRSVTGLDHQPDILWIKTRSTTDDHRVQDAVRGSTKQLDVNNTDEEYTASDGITSFNSDGFTIGADSSNQFNVNTETYVAWSWKANGSGGANNSGDINATVSANTTAGISIVKWTANGSNADTIAHGLGVKPSVVWYKKIDNGGHGWYVLTDAIDGSQDYLAMNTTTSPLASAGAYGWATSSTISNWTWNDGHGMIAYCFAEVEGFSKFGNYTGNGSTNGVYVNCGFTPSYVLFKNHSGSAWWWCHDTGRDPSNLNTLILFPNATTADYTSGSNGVDFLSNGIKLRADNDLNGSSQNVFYMAFAEFPFKYANAR